MRRKLLFTLCITNALVALLILGIFLPKLRPTKSKLQTEENTIQGKIELSDAERWSRALAAQNPLELNNYLNQIQDIAYKQSKLRNELQKLLNSPATACNNMHDIERYCTLISAKSKLDNSTSELKLTAQLIQQRELPITLREAAFRNYILRSVELRKNSKEANGPIVDVTPYIDHAYTESQTSLCGIALSADWYLLQNALLSKERQAQLQKRLIETIQAADSIDSNLQTALAILQAEPHHHVLDNDTLYQLYADHESEMIRSGILLYFTAKKDSTTLKWLHSQTASSSGIERNLLAAKEACHATTMATASKIESN
jgi:mRNA-degrading endonuclease YafQ of YafQ-DinJ toxin-antitoxin module